MLQPVSQVSPTGCFIACVAMLLETSYEKAFGLLRPGVSMDSMYSHGFEGMSVEAVAHEQLQKIGFKTHTGKYRQFRTYKERMKKNAIMIVRWKFDPTSCHCVLFDAAGKRFIDPSGGYIVDSESELRRYQRQLDVPIIIDKAPRILKDHRDIHRDAPTDRITWRDSRDESDPFDLYGEVPIRAGAGWGLAAKRTPSDYDWD